ncbi:AAA family ATPase [Fodinisporobacter ferrooxydans]|uniref:AAA family ATPase n=1 Tax=Fodinisporobacter ferrooxydans TaxID=2901836 RepID=A0ABY4CMX8_9BACL|nr:AAA family ATPase [Alicyclobacillaceae bacterium MYW30-H2]
MIRSAKIPDIWRKIERNSYKYYIESLNLNGILGINEPINFKKGIFAICGLNGVGKSTVFTAIKDILGINIREQDKIKIQGIEIQGNLKEGNKDILIKNEDGCRLIDVISDEVLLEEIDYMKLIEINKFISQPNFNELIEQYDDNIFDESDLRQLNYLVGKTYDSVVLREIEIEDNVTVPYFQILCNGLEYDSLKMGTGEHFLFYVYWLFKRITKSGIILIEEPEVFISVNSQINLMNFIADKMNEHRFSVILVTHSPFILQNISQDRMVILQNYLNSVDVVNPEYKEDILQDLGLDINRKGIFIFEDALALEFFKSICKRHALYFLKYFRLEKTSGYSDITKIISIPRLKQMDYKIIGVYDGDVKNSGKIQFSNLNWGYVFLPGEISLEEQFQKLTRIYFNELSLKLSLGEHELRILLAKVQGIEYHDWLIELANKTHKDFSTVVDIFYDLWEKENLNQIEEFLSDLSEAIKK